MELIIPKTDIPGSTELMLPEFLDNYILRSEKFFPLNSLMLSNKD